MVAHLKRMKILTTILLLLAGRLGAQTPPLPSLPHEHLITNIVTRACITYHYYGISPNGQVSFIASLCDANPMLKQFENGEFHPPFRFIIRATNSLTFNVIKQNLQCQPAKR